jgi:hypothetical protein
MSCPKRKREWLEACKSIRPVPRVADRQAPCVAGGGHLHPDHGLHDGVGGWVEGGRVPGARALPGGDDSAQQTEEGDEEGEGTQAQGAPLQGGPLLLAAS